MQTPYCVTFQPTDPHIFLVGSTSRKVRQFDSRVGNTHVVEYNYHLGTVNTITFYDASRRIATTGDDKQILLWDLGAPVPIKYIADPEMHSIPAATLDPTGRYYAGQSMDNQVVVYETERFNLNRKKRFTGHTNAGYACQLSFAPNGQYLASGDGAGKLWIWNWKNGRPLIRAMDAHDSGPAIGCQWHPVEASYVATCGWDGLIKLWASDAVR